MIASVYIKDGNIHFYNENRSYSGIGGLVYELGKPLLDFVCYEPERFDDGFSIIAEVFDNEYAYISAKAPEFISFVKQMMGDFQQKEIYLFFYNQMIIDFIFTFIDSPQHAIKQLDDKISGAQDKFRWAWDFYWPVTNNPTPDKEKQLFRAVKDAISVMYDHFCKFQSFIKQEIDVLIHYRGKIEVPPGRSIDYIDILDEYHSIMGYENFYLEKPFRTFYGRVSKQEIAHLYEIDRIEDIFRFEFIKMAEYDIFIRKCKNCERFFIPKRRADAEYCERIWGDSQRKCSEVGATLRYERKVAENPVLEAHKKAYRRFNSRTRAKKMTQGEFMRWSEEAAKKRDECLAGNLPFDEFVAWLEQGRIRKSRSKPYEQKDEVKK